MSGTASPGKTMQFALNSHINMCFPPPWSVLGIGLEQKTWQSTAWAATAAPSAWSWESSAARTESSPEEAMQCALTVIYSQAGPLTPEEKFKRKEVPRKDCRAYQVTALQRQQPALPSRTGFSPSLSLCKAASPKPGFTNRFCSLALCTEYRATEILSSAPQKFIAEQAGHHGALFLAYGLKFCLVYFLLVLSWYILYKGKIDACFDVYPNTAITLLLYLKNAYSTKIS